MSIDPINFESPDWSPFLISEKRPNAPRAMHTKEGVGDRLRSAAFAEIQAKFAFLWASETFSDATDSLRSAWIRLAKAEDRHLGWLLKRMEELEIDVKEKAVSDFLWKSFMKCKTAKEFAIFMANAEERGRLAGEKFYTSLKDYDPISAEIFRQIAIEEIEHIELARTHFPEDSLLN